LYLRGLAFRSGIKGVETMSKPKILFYDVECTPLIAAAWMRYKTDLVKVFKHKELLSVAWQWQGESTVHCLTREGKKNDLNVVKQLHELLSEADVSVAHNGDGFDKRLFRTRSEIHRLPVTPRLLSVDTCKAGRNYFGFTDNSLNGMCEQLGIGSKLPNPGFSMWEGCMADEARSWKRMARYNKHDIVLLKGLYDRIKPHIENHPNLARFVNPDAERHECPMCVSSNTVKNGQRPGKQKWFCKDCGQQFLSTRRKGDK
jgi:uncharacterized protein YprB with RNaseH-like and TPR domain